MSRLAWQLAGFTRHARPSPTARAEATWMQRAHAFLCSDCSRRQWTRCMALLVYRAAARPSAGPAMGRDGWTIMKPRRAAMLARAGDRLHADWLLGP